MKKILNLIAVLLFSVAVHAQFNSSRDPYINKSLSKDAIHDVYARTSGGGITITGGAESEARLEIYVRSNNNDDLLSKEEIKKRLEEDYDLELTVSGGKLTVIAKPKSSFSMNWKKSLSISYTIYVPKNVSTDLGTSGGGISMAHLSGTQNFSTSGGGLDLDDLSGKIRGRTSGGGISVSNTRDDVDLSTSGGGIEADNCSGTINLSTSGGSIDLDRMKGTVTAKTSGGSISGSGFHGELEVYTSGGSVRLRDIAGSVDASTSGGNIDLEIDELGKYVTASNSGGNVHLALPANKGIDLKLRAEHINMQVQNFSGSQEEHRVNGTVNGGGPQVDVSTSGSITVAFR